MDFSAETTLRKQAGPDQNNTYLHQRIAADVSTSKCSVELMDISFHVDMLSLSSPLSNIDRLQ